MGFRLVVPKERWTGERRVALVPEVAVRLVKMGFEVVVESGAGTGAYFSDADYTAVGAQVGNGASMLAAAQLLLKVQPPEPEEIAALPEGCIVISFLFPHRFTDRIEHLRRKKITAFAMESVPRVTRAQTMDALSSQSTVAGYQAAVMAAQLSGRFFPMLTTAAGTIRPAKVLVIGAGVAGLQAIATARRLGAVVEAYDVRRATKEQVESLGARFVEVGINAEAEGGYARELTAEERSLAEGIVADRVAQADVVISTAQVPGRPSPRLISRETVERMRPGAVIVDLGADGGGNCELTRPGTSVEHHGVTIHGPVNLASQLPTHASEMYARNLLNFVVLLTKEGRSVEPDWTDEVVSGTALMHAGEMKNAPGWCLVTGGKR
ncbi:MAG: Re/Si-specific NAD(P)(+) transhydrogenase subunit alpha [Deltaproteobacteria bacterium]|nr:Re/Si-specific NAD(P)(+) transhydrogenase subunit alpha [Deltaproteobacteria bacterium]